MLSDPSTAVGRVKLTNSVRFSASTAGSQCFAFSFLPTFPAFNLTFLANFSSPTVVCPLILDITFLVSHNCHAVDASSPWLLPNEEAWLVGRHWGRKTGFTTLERLLKPHLRTETICNTMDESSPTLSASLLRNQFILVNLSPLTSATLMSN